MMSIFGQACEAQHAGTWACRTLSPRQSAMQGSPAYVDLWSSSTHRNGRRLSGGRLLALPRRVECRQPPPPPSRLRRRLLAARRRLLLRCLLLRLGGSSVVPHRRLHLALALVGMLRWQRGRGADQQRRWRMGCGPTCKSIMRQREPQPQRTKASTCRLGLPCGQRAARLSPAPRRGSAARRPPPPPVHLGSRGSRSRPPATAGRWLQRPAAGPAAWPAAEKGGGGEGGAEGGEQLLLLLDFAGTCG